MADGRARDSARHAIVDEGWQAVRERPRARLATQVGDAASAASEEGTGR